MAEIDGVPVIGLFTGERLWDLPPDAEHFARIPTDIQRANWAAHADAPDSYPVGTGLSQHLAATYYPPNVPGPARCWRLGEALRAGIESWDGDGAALGQLPADMLRSGTSETLNWITAGAFATWNRDRAVRAEQETAA